jgi:hypothetical protein
MQSQVVDLAEQLKGLQLPGQLNITNWGYNENLFLVSCTSLKSMEKAVAVGFGPGVTLRQP